MASTSTAAQASPIPDRLTLLDEACDTLNSNFDTAQRLLPLFESSSSLSISTTTAVNTPSNPIVERLKATTGSALVSRLLLLRVVPSSDKSTNKSTSTNSLNNPLKEEKARDDKSSSKQNSTYVSQDPAGSLSDTNLSGRNVREGVGTDSHEGKNSEKKPLNDPEEEPPENMIGLSTSLGNFLTRRLVLPTSSKAESPLTALDIVHSCIALLSKRELRRLLLGNDPNRKSPSPPPQSSKSDDDEVNSKLDIVVQTLHQLEFEILTSNKLYRELTEYWHEAVASMATQAAQLPDAKISVALQQALPNGRECAWLLYCCVSLERDGLSNKSAGDSNAKKRHEEEMNTRRNMLFSTMILLLETIGDEIGLVPPQGPGYDGGNKRRKTTMDDEREAIAALSMIMMPQKNASSTPNNNDSRSKMDIYFKMATKRGISSSEINTEMKNIQNWVSDVRSREKDLRDGSLLQMLPYLERLYHEKNMRRVVNSINAAKKSGGVSSWEGAVDEVMLYHEEGVRACMVRPIDIKTVTENSSTVKRDVSGAPIGAVKSKMDASKGWRSLPSTSSVANNPVERQPKPSNFSPDTRPPPPITGNAGTVVHPAPTRPQPRLLPIPPQGFPHEHPSPSHDLMSAKNTANCHGIVPPKDHHPMPNNSSSNIYTYSVPSAQSKPNPSELSEWISRLCHDPSLAKPSNPLTTHFDHSGGVALWNTITAILDRALQRLSDYVGDALNDNEDNDGNDNREMPQPHVVSESGEITIKGLNSNISKRPNAEDNSALRHQIQTAVLALYYHSLESILALETKRLRSKSHPTLLSNHIFHRSLLAVGAQTVLRAMSCHAKTKLKFPSVLNIMEIAAFDFLKVSESFVRAVWSLCDSKTSLGASSVKSSHLGLPLELRQHLQECEETILSKLLWDESSTLVSNKGMSIRAAIDSLRHMSDMDMSGNAPIWPPFSLRPLDIHEGGGGGNNNNSPERIHFKRDLNKSSITPQHQQHHLTVSFVFRKLITLSARRILEITEKLSLDEFVTEQIWISFKFCIAENIYLLYDRHIDQLILCTVYGVCKIARINPEVSFAKIIETYYELNPHQDSENQFVIRHIPLVASSASVNSNGDRKTGNIIYLYNQVFVPSMKGHLLKFQHYASQQRARAGIMNVDDATKLADNPTTSTKNNGYFEGDIVPTTTYATKCKLLPVRGPLHTVSPSRVENTNLFVSNTNNAEGSGNGVVGTPPRRFPSGLGSALTPRTRALYAFGEGSTSDLNLINKTVNSNGYIPHLPISDDDVDHDRRNQYHYPNGNVSRPIYHPTTQETRSSFPSHGYVVHQRRR